MAAKKKASKPKIDPTWLNKKNMAASAGVSEQAFTKWGVEPIAKIGRQTFYKVRDVLLNRRENLLANQQKEQPEDDDIKEERRKLIIEQRRKLEIENAENEERLVPIEDVRIAVNETVVQLASLLDGAAGKMSGGNAVLRTKLLDEHRRIRKAFADGLARYGGDPEGE